MEAVALAAVNKKGEDVEGKERKQEQVSVP